MSEQSAPSSGFVKAFIPGLVVGFVVGAAVGVIVATTGGNISKLNTNNTPVDRPAQTDADREGFIDEAQQAGEEIIEETQDAVEDAADDLQETIEDQIPETEGEG